MRFWLRYRLLIPVLLMVLVLGSCSDNETSVDDEGRVTASLVLVLPSANGLQTRQADEVLQINDQPYRGMQDVQILPYQAQQYSVGVQTTDRLTVFSITELSTNSYPKTGSRFYYYNACSFSRGTNAVLFYGRAVPSGTKAYNGSLLATFPEGMHPAAIAFDLEQMTTTTDVTTDAQAIADYLTAIARATGWSNSSDSRLRSLYQVFIGQTDDGYAVMAGSSRSVGEYVKNLKSIIESLASSDVKTAILTAIGTPSLGNYPASLNLPDGIAALQWEPETEKDGKKGCFVVQTTTTTVAPITSINRMVYPAELYYFCNSQLYTSIYPVSESVYQSGYTSWEEVLAAYYTVHSGITGSTRAVALAKPIQYGVARLKVNLQEPVAPNAVTLQDAKGNTVAYEREKMPLKGVIIGGQHQVGFDFKPKGEQVNNPMRFVYDSQVSGITTNTMVLQSYANEKVNVILEFENNTEAAFTGKDGVIYPGTRFYLIGELDPTTKTGAEDYHHQVFTQDHTTEVTMKFGEHSLAQAYNVMPNLMEPRLEVGVELVGKWIQTEPTSVILN